jgi:8-oxo-dGTP pyrophosphatase MutT (NUDIX family)
MLECNAINKGAIMAEFLDVYDANGKLIGSADRNVVHACGLWHKTVHCWIAWDGKIVFQRRSRKLDTNGGKLYTTASGHVSAGESIEEAFAREISQEIGIRPQNLKFLEETTWVKDMKKSDGSIMSDRVFANIFWAEHNGEIGDFQFTDGEVDSVVAIDLGDFAKFSIGGAGKINGLEFDGTDAKEVVLENDDFLLNAGETLYSKYGKIAEMILRNM